MTDTGDQVTCTLCQQRFSPGEPGSTVRVDDHGEQHYCPMCWSGQSWSDYTKPKKPKPSFRKICIVWVVCFYAIAGWMSFLEHMLDASDAIKVFLLLPGAAFAIVTAWRFLYR